MKWLRTALLDDEVTTKNYTLLSCSALTYEERFSVYGEILTWPLLLFFRFEMLWQFIKRHRRKLFLLSLLTGGQSFPPFVRSVVTPGWFLGGYAAARFLHGKMSTMLDEQDRMVNEWKKQLYYEHNRDTSLKTSECDDQSDDDQWGFRYGNLRTSDCEYRSSFSMRTNLGSSTDDLRVSSFGHFFASTVRWSSSAEKRQLWEQLRIECKRREFFSFSSRRCFHRFRSSVHLGVQLELRFGIDWTRRQRSEWSTLFSISNPTNVAQRTSTDHGYICGSVLSDQEIVACRSKSTEGLNEEIDRLLF